jgi:hypothetical protein
MKVGDVVRVKDWPGVGRRRFVVVKVTESHVEARDASKGGVRIFPRELCTVDRKATSAHRSRKVA